MSHDATHTERLSRSRIAAVSEMRCSCQPSLQVAQWAGVSANRTNAKLVIPVGERMPSALPINGASLPSQIRALDGHSAVGMVRAPGVVAHT
jgi:hypothetical protein